MILLTPKITENVQFDLQIKLIANSGQKGGNKPFAQLDIKSGHAIKLPNNICFKHNHRINQTHSQNKSTIFTISNDKYKTMCDIHYNVQEHIKLF